MIVLNILDPDESRIHEMAAWLLTEKLSVTLEIDWNRNRFSIDAQENVKTEKIHKISSITKAAAFNEIHQSLMHKYPENPPEIYSLPVVYMDWEQTSKIKNGIRA